MHIRVVYLDHSYLRQLLPVYCGSMTMLSSSVGQYQKNQDNDCGIVIKYLALQMITGDCNADLQMCLWH